jgi:aspartate/methionine/tyrosine aminotransferase
VDLSDVAFSEELTRRQGLAAISLSPFGDEPVEASLVRFCSAKEDRMLEAAAARRRAV